MVMPYTPSREGLHLLVDSTGIKFLGEGEWKRKKHGAGYHRQWRKIHLGIDAETVQIWAITVTDSTVGNNTALPNLIGQIPDGEQIATVTGDGAFDTRTAMKPLWQEALFPAFPPERMPRLRQILRQPEPGQEMKPSAPYSVWAGESGDSGRAIAAQFGGDQDVLLQATR